MFEEINTALSGQDLNEDESNFVEWLVRIGASIDEIISEVTFWRNYSEVIAALQNLPGGWRVQAKKLLREGKSVTEVIDEITNQHKLNVVEKNINRLRDEALKNSSSNEDSPSP